ncbi:MAG: RHS repeat-associated core domain-containing protein [Gammaproteobacteria bacterium]
MNNRLTEASLSGVPQVRYTYNGRGERVKKKASGITYYHYDPSGQLLAETDLQGQTLKEYLYLEGIPLAVAAAKATPSGVYALQGQDRSGQTFRLTLAPQTRTLSLDGLGEEDGTYSIAPERWRETRDTLLASHTTPSGARLKVKLVLTGASPTGTLTLTHSPRKARYTLNETRGDGIYSGRAEKSGKTVRLTINEDTRSLTLLEQDQPPRTLTVDPEDWQLNQTKRAKHLRFGAEAAGLTLKGALHLGKDGHVGGYLKLREGERQKSHYALTARPTASGSAGLYYIHTDQLGTPQVLTDEAQQVVWAADYQPFSEATLTKDNVTFNLRFPGQYFDSETGLHYNYFRDYDPSIGRYIESDPIGLAGGLNTYAYVLGNPLSYIDPFGLLSIVDAYPSRGAAALAATSDVLAISISADREYAGRIYKNPDGTYSYTPANPGTAHTSNPDSRINGFSNAGRYHTHGAESPGYDDENFSDQDKFGSDFWREPSYLRAPHGLGT